MIGILRVKGWRPPITTKLYVALLYLHHNGMSLSLSREFQLTHDSGKKQKKLYKYPIAVYTVLSSWWWTEEPPERCRAFIVINTTV